MYILITVDTCQLKKFTFVNLILRIFLPREIDIKQAQVNLSGISQLKNTKKRAGHTLRG